MFDFQTKMRREIEDIPDALQRLLDSAVPSITDAAHELRDTDPKVICTIARGSSDHAAAYLKYAIELTARLPVASLGPSVNSIYGVDLKLDSAACIAISQSGKSPDITAMAQSARDGGATTVAITNESRSPLATVCNHTINIHAGKEESVAATKTFLTSIVSGLLLLGHWQDDQKLLDGLNALPQLAQKAIECDWSPLTRRLLREDALYVLGRGPSFAIANEVALKFKETCQIQGEAFSSAEVLHGPVSIVASNYPVLVLAARDRSSASICAVADDLVARGGDVFITASDAQKAAPLPHVATDHPLTDPLMLAISFYAFIEQLARLRGFDPDTPRNLKKVTETV